MSSNLRYRVPIMRFWRKNKVSRVTAAAPMSSTCRSMSITCRGKKILDREDLFQYTNGRFLTNEKYARDRRYIRFDVDSLCTIAASVGQPSPIQAIEKIEGGFSKALLLKKENGSELVAKIPFSIAGPPRYTTASEVAVLRYVREHTRIPVPRVLAWNTDSSNPVGAEYIIMEKAPGVQLFSKWGDMDELEQFKLIKNLARFEGELTEIRFPANGSLYLRESLGENDRRTELGLEVDPSQQFCIARSCDRSWYDDDDTADLQSGFDIGPWPDLSTFGIAQADREVARIEQDSERKSVRLTNRPPRGAISEELSVLSIAKEIMSLIGPNTLMQKVSRPVMWHTDLHLGNIFVSETDPTEIVSLIDWQYVAISPLYLQARFPEFLSVGPNTAFEFGMEFPQLPENFDDLDIDEKKIVEFRYVEAKLAKGYELATGAYNNDGYKALCLPFFLQELFLRTGEASKEGVLPLRACLTQIFEAWGDLEFLGAAPSALSDGILSGHEEDLQKYHDYHKINELVKDALGTDSEGWISHQSDFQTKKRENENLLRYFMAHSADYNMTPDELRSIWPFLEE